MDSHVNHTEEDMEATCVRGGATDGKSARTEPNKIIVFHVRIPHSLQKAKILYRREKSTGGSLGLARIEDLNVILVDWQKGAKAPNYYQAVANTRTVGAMIGRLLEDLKAHAGAEFETFHLVGHSLGSHIMGYAGKEAYRLTNVKVGRITGLDPAGPAFESYSHYVRLDALDANFVDVIHTDAESLISTGFGIRCSIGHVDFYPNGGQHQPGCPEETLDDFSTVTCSHIRVLDFFTNSISKCRYDPPGDNGKVCTMGYHTDSTCRGDFYPMTTATQPFC
ncbi:pancreatic lipase-related protein [Plakobranchus ocellatus]|uniref:Pancreatic lipase-related protein n=1 Tax=Plakobranchus ocellatus TaxID=259542 RepID=A0AAV4BLC1_9GAST|nr:pancreatic lipase-related protein [Plakobranchus ocellatus]